MSDIVIHGSSDDWNKMNPKFRTRILSELTRLKADVQNLRHQAVHDVSQLGEQSAEIAHLKAEVERLTKAHSVLKTQVVQLTRGGDELLEIIDGFYCPERGLAHEIWSAAKKGKLLWD